ncbi:MAG TPA: AEC family transporter [Vicinamibacterales bacterium]|nr:AEC family transporter [Vicinamibacterales bacterium]
MPATAHTSQLLLGIFASDILPIFVIAGVGFLLARHLAVQVQTLSRVTFHALAPALVFTMLTTSTLTGLEFGRMAAFYALVAASSAAMARLAAIPLRLDRASLSAFLLVVVCSNSGNYGLPVALLAFGREALTFASVYFVSSAIFSYTGGILLAASGRRSVAQALAGVARVPAVYGAVAAAIVMAFGLQVPEAVARPMTLLSDAALPMMVLVLGMQLERTTWPERPDMVAVAALLSLVATPLAAFGIAHVVGLQGAAFQAGVLQASMPTAVVTTILALEFNVAPNFVTSVVCVTTLLSPITLTVLIAYLQRIA